ncbi:MAG: fatty acid desaturase family protein [Deltaproteobacteria bacterium]|nr:fatty acid desaturase family protein [Deltaproteobacteria bacterium]
MSATVKTAHSAHRYLEMFGIAAFAILEVVVAWRSLTHAHTVLDWLVVAGATLAGFVAADFMSGLVHWAFDRYGSDDTPLFGPNFIVPFREHHVDPKGITRHDFIETNGNNCIATVPILAGAASLDPTWGAMALLTSCFLGAMCLFVFATNQCHKWAHEDEPPTWVAALQRWHLILDKPGHDVHHNPPFETYYCITTGWLNPLLARLDFFARAERLIFKLTGVKGGIDDAKVVGDRRAS